jgi:branched-chain amino acid transport system permease protein
MSAAYWRKAMNFGNRGQTPISHGSAAAAVLPRPVMVPGSGIRALTPIVAALSFRHVAVFVFLLALPWFATPFFTYQIGAQSLALGLIALSLTFLAGYGGMISLAQMTVAGIAGYMVGIFGTSGVVEISLKWPWWIVVPLAIAIATVAAAFIGWLSVRTEGIYTIMITLAVGVAF